MAISHASSQISAASSSSRAWTSARCSAVIGINAMRAA